MSGVRPETIGAVPGSSPSLYGLLPRGVIVLWSGRLRDIPSGWALCDGRFGTPNLTARFIRGVNTATTEPGTTGGNDTKTPTSPAHSHELPMNFKSPDLGFNPTFFGSGTTRSMSQGVNPGSPAVSNPVGLTQSVAVSINAFDVRPAYFELAFIMKL